MKTAFFTIISDSHYYGCRTDDFIRSFKYFHPDIDLIIFGQKQIEETFSLNPRLNFYNSKATFAKQLYNDYELVVNIDADHLILDSLDEILLGDYDVAIPTNYNAWLNTSLGTCSFTNLDGMCSSNILIPSERYIQGGLIASTSKLFWDQYEHASLNYAHLFGTKENDVLNLVCHLLPWRLKVLEGHWEYTHSDFKCYYGCASLGREREVVVSGNRLKLDGKPLKAYHFARAGIIKPQPAKLFCSDVVKFIEKKVLKRNYFLL